MWASVCTSSWQAWWNLRWTMDGDMFVNSFHSILHFTEPWNWNKYSEVISTEQFLQWSMLPPALESTRPDFAKLWKVQNQAYRYYLVVSSKHWQLPLGKCVGYQQHQLGTIMFWWRVIKRNTVFMKCTRLLCRGRQFGRWNSSISLVP